MAYEHLNVLVSPELKRYAVRAAKRAGMSLTAWVVQLIEADQDAGK